MKTSPDPVANALFLQHVAISQAIELLQKQLDNVATPENATWRDVGVTAHAHDCANLVIERLA
jgi:hypothetical protein